jgi:hypothetical protein
MVMDDATFWKIADAWDAALAQTPERHGHQDFFHAGDGVNGMLRMSKAAYDPAVLQRLAHHFRTAVHKELGDGFIVAGAKTTWTLQDGRLASEPHGKFATVTYEVRPRPALYVE